MPKSRPKYKGYSDTFSFGDFWLINCYYCSYERGIFVVARFINSNTTSRNCFIVNLLTIGTGDYLWCTIIMSHSHFGQLFVRVMLNLLLRTSAYVHVECVCGRIVSKIFQPDPVLTVSVVLIMALKCLSAVESENYLSYIFIIKMHRDVFLQLPSSILEHNDDCIYVLRCSMVYPMHVQRTHSHRFCHRFK